MTIFLSDNIFTIESFKKNENKHTGAVGRSTSIRGFRPGFVVDKDENKKAYDAVRSYNTGIEVVELIQIFINCLV